MKEIEIAPLPLKTQDGQHIRACLIKRITDKTTTDCQELWFSFDSSIPALDNDDCDSYLLAVLMDAMKEGRHINVKGSVSRALLSNLTEFQSAWNKWLPQQYSIIEINADQYRSDAPRVAGAVCAFSGGVDATFSVWRHNQKKCGHRSQLINLCTLVHGFDIPLSDQIAFDRACTRAKNTLADLHLTLFPIATNYRDISTANWEHSHACALVASLSNLKLVAGTAIIGSSDPYDSLCLPWGSNPITDPLLSSDNFKALHDGSSHNRTEKVNDIADFQTGLNNLRVCWQGDIKDSNCGSCEKCVRTKLNFLAAGLAIPKSLPNVNLLEDIANIKLKPGRTTGEWKQIYAYAQKNQVTGAWVDAVKKKITGRKTILNQLFPQNSRRRHLAGKLKALVRG